MVQVSPEPPGTPHLAAPGSLTTPGCRRAEQPIGAGGGREYLGADTTFSGSRSLRCFRANRHHGDVPKQPGLKHRGLP